MIVYTIAVKPYTVITRPNGGFQGLSPANTMIASINPKKISKQIQPKQADSRSARTTSNADQKKIPIMMQEFVRPRVYHARCSMSNNSLKGAEIFAVPSHIIGISVNAILKTIDATSSDTPNPALVHSRRK